MIGMRAFAEDSLGALIEDSVRLIEQRPIAHLAERGQHIAVTSDAKHAEADLRAIASELMVLVRYHVARAAP